MQIDSIAAATVTWARTLGEEELLRTSLARLATIGVPVAVADKPTSPDFSSFLRRLPGFTVIDALESGLVGQVRASVTLAAGLGTPFVLYVEPDKTMFFEHRLRDFVSRAPESDDVGVVIAARSSGSYETFPSFQRYTEGVINHIVGEMIGRAGDYSYGPFLMNRALMTEIAAVDARLGWGWRHFIFLAAHRRGLDVLHLEDDYPCPDDQREEGEAERRHRLRQLSENILGVIAR